MILSFLAVAVAIAGYIMAYAMSTMLLTPWWYVALGAAVIAAGTGVQGWRIWQGLTGRPSFLPNYLTHVAVVAGIAMAVLFGLNLVESPSKPPTRHTYAIKRIYRSKHHRMRRVTRRVYRADGPAYYRYNVEIEPAQGRTLRFTVPQKRYIRLKRCDSVTVTHHHGLLGMTYVTA